MQFSRSNTFASALLTCALLSPTLPALASVPDETITITLDQAVHFIGTDGSVAVADPGDYSVEAAQEWLRLIPGTERRDALLIEAQPRPHEVKVEIPIVISTPGTEPDELDLHIVQLLNPDGTSLVANGTYSGIQSRGWRDRARRAAARARAKAEGARRAAAAKAKNAADAARIAALKAKQEAEQAARIAALKAKQTLQALIAQPEESRLEKSRRVPPTQFLIGSDNIFSNASGWRRKVCGWVGGHVIPQHQWGCQSHIDLANGRIQVKADRYGAGIRMDIHADAWVEIYKDFTVPPSSESGQNQTKMATFNVPVEYHGKAVSTMPYWPARYKMFLMLDQISSGPEQALHLEKRVLEDETVRAFIKAVKGMPLPLPDVDLATQKNPVYFNAPVIPGRTYRLTLRVEVVASGSPVRGSVAGLLEGSAVNFMDKAMKISSRERVDGYIKWGPVRLIIHP